MFPELPNIKILIMAIIRQYSTAKTVNTGSTISYFPARPLVDTIALEDNREFILLITACLKDGNGLITSDNNIKFTINNKPHWFIIQNQITQADGSGYVTLQIKGRLAYPGTEGYHPVGFTITNESKPEISRLGVISFSR